MSVPSNVPPDVPPVGPAPSRPRPAESTPVTPAGPAAAPAAGPGSQAPRGRGGPTYVTREPSGWRFQWRLPASLAGVDFRLADPTPILRASLGPRSRGEARRLGRELATLCQAVSAAAVAANTKGDPMPTDEQPLDGKRNDLVQKVVAACQASIDRAIKHPAQAIGLARALEGSLTSLRLVGTEVAKGDAGARAVVDNAEALTRHALTDVLNLSRQPEEALAALAAVPAVAPGPLDALSTTSGVGPSLMASTALKPPPRARGGGGLPTFGETSRAYIDMRIERDGADHPDIQVLEMRRRTFIDLIGDWPIDQYVPSDLQSYVNQMQFWPAHIARGDDMDDRTTEQILDDNKNLALMPLALKTMKSGFVTNIRTMGRHLMMDRHYRDPFAGAKLTWPKNLRPSLPREPVGVAVTNRVFRNGVASGLLAHAMLPPLAKLTSRRLGLLAFLQGRDIRRKHGVWVAQTSGIVLDPDSKQWRRVPIKTEESMTFFVLHNFLAEIGFVDWARRQDGWIFAALHEHPDPSKYTSKAMGKLLKRSGAKGGEVFHSFRGEGIDAMRKGKVRDRSGRLQSGHELGDVHDKYGFRALDAEECRRLANLPLPKGIDWKVLEGLDFDAMAKARPTKGRRPKGS